MKIPKEILTPELFTKIVTVYKMVLKVHKRTVAEDALSQLFSMGEYHFAQGVAENWIQRLSFYVQGDQVEVVLEYAQHYARGKMGALMRKHADEFEEKIKKLT